MKLFDHLLETHTNNITVTPYSEIVQKTCPTKLDFVQLYTEMECDNEIDCDRSLL